jgi:hypothetical protein
MLLWTWVFTILGAVLMWIIMLADAMSSGPRIHLGLAAVALPMPVIAVILAGIGLNDLLRAGGALRVYFALGIPLFIALSSLVAWIAFFWPKSS